MPKRCPRFRSFQFSQFRYSPLSCFCNLIQSTLRRHPFPIFPNKSTSPFPQSYLLVPILLPDLSRPILIYQPPLALPPTPTSLPSLPHIDPLQTLPLPITPRLQVPNLRTLIAQVIIHALARADRRGTLETIQGRGTVRRQQALCVAELDVFGPDVRAVPAGVEGVGVVAHFWGGGRVLGEWRVDGGA